MHNVKTDIIHVTFAYKKTSLPDTPKNNTYPDTYLKEYAYPKMKDLTKYLTYLKVENKIQTYFKTFELLLGLLTI